MGGSSGFFAAALNLVAFALFVAVTSLLEHLRPQHDHNDLFIGLNLFHHDRREAAQL